MIACYILPSPDLDKFYIGITQDSVENRILKHNNASYGKHFTSEVNDWEIFLTGKIFVPDAPKHGMGCSISFDKVHGEPYYNYFPVLKTNWIYRK